MKYPKYLSKYGYCNLLKLQYEKEYSDFFSTEMIENTISYIISNIIGLMNQTDKELLIKVIKYLSSLELMTKEEYLEAIKEITPGNIAGILFGATKKLTSVAKLIAFQAEVSINDDNKEKYLEFLKAVTIQSTKELAVVNQPKPISSKRIIFSEDLAPTIMVREFEIGEDMSKQTDLTNEEKEHWYSRQKKDFKEYYKKERQKDLQLFDQELKASKENVDPKYKKPKRDNSTV